MLWIVPIVKGFKMYRFDGGLVWERTEKVDANNALIRKEPREAEPIPA